VDTEGPEKVAVSSDQAVLTHLTISLPLLLIAVTSLRADTIIRSVDVRGNVSLTARDITSAIVSKPSMIFSHSQLASDLNAILRMYHDNGYYFVHVSVDTLAYTADSASIDIQLSIDEGEQTATGSLRLEGNTLFTVDEILNRFDTRPGRTFVPTVLENDIDNLLGRYEQIGRPFARVVIAGLVPMQDSAGMSVAIDLAIDEGMVVRLNEIRVEGNKETKSDVIVRETRIRQGELYNHTKIRTIPQRLGRLNIFSSVSEPELYVNDGGGGILIRVREGPSNTFDGIVGYVPGGTNERGYVMGLANVGMRNIFGTGRKFNVRWQREDRFSQELFLRYLEPWVLDLPVNLSGSFFQRQQDTVYVKRMVELKTELLATEDLSFGALYLHEDVIPSAGIVPPVVYNSSTITVGLEVLYDSRDDVLSPLSGVAYRSDYRVGRKKIFGLPATAAVTPRNTIHRLGLDFEWYLEPVVRQVIALGLHGRELESNQIELSDLYRFGGAHTLRGYRENQFIGSRVVWSNVEYRFLLARRSFVFGFFDTGYYFRPSDPGRGIPLSQGVKYGYGVGVRLETTLGNIGVSFALGEGDSFSQGKIHFGLVSEF
jgi:outer membrane protein insertion porin family